MFDILVYRKAHSVAEAVALLAADPSARPLAGGTDILVRLRDFAPGYDNLVDIHDLPALKGIRLCNDCLQLGAGVSFSDLLDSPLVQLCLPLLVESAASVAGPQIRNMGTLGGNLCNGAVSADLVPPLLACNATLQLLGPAGPRTLPLCHFHTGPGRVALLPGELLLQVDISPDNWQGLGGHFVKYAMRDSMDIATIACAAALRLRHGRLHDLRLAFSVAGPTPLRCPHAESAAEGQPLNAATLAALSQAALADVQPRDSWRASADFRRQIVRTLAQRVVAEAARRAGGGERDEGEGESGALPRAPQGA